MNGFDCLVYLKNQELYRRNTHHHFHHLKKSPGYQQNPTIGRQHFMTKPDDFNILCKKLKKLSWVNPSEGLYII